MRGAGHRNHYRLIIATPSLSFKHLKAETIIAPACGRVFRTRHPFYRKAQMKRLSSNISSNALMPPASDFTTSNAHQWPTAGRLPIRTAGSHPVDNPHQWLSNRATRVGTSPYRRITVRHPTRPRRGSLIFIRANGKDPPRVEPDTRRIAYLKEGLKTLSHHRDAMIACSKNVAQ